jgi:hypothetical protein
LGDIERPLDPDAVRQADDQIYQNHVNDPRPNALFDADGNHLQIDNLDPKQAALRDEWCDLYRAALKKKKNAADSGAKPKDSAADSSGSPTADPPPSDKPVGNPVQSCPLKTHWIQIVYKKQPDLKARPLWWIPDAGGGYAGESFSAQITDGPKRSSLDGDGSTRYDGIPGGDCWIKLPQFFQSIETLLGPKDTWPG